MATDENVEILSDVDLDSDEYLKNIEDQSLTNPVVLPIELFNKRTAKTTQLVNNTNAEFKQKGKHQWYNLAFTDEVWISKIIVETSGYNSLDKMDFTVGARSLLKKSSVANSQGEFEISVNDLASSFSFLPPLRYFSEKLITRITVVGFTKREYSLINSELGNIDNYKQNVINECSEHIRKAKYAVHKFDSVNEKISSKESHFNDVEDELAKLKLARSNLESQLSELNSKESNLTTRIESLEDSIDQKKNTQKQLNNDVADKTSELKKLVDNINIFPSEIGSFVDQGANAIRKYMLFGAVPIIVLALITYSLYSNAVDLTTLYKTQPDIDLLTVLLTRLPYVAVAGMLITACYKLIRYFISEIIKINQQRLNLSKVSIIANDISLSSAEGLDFDDAQIYHYRNKFKMELLKEHLKEYITPDYEYMDNEPLLNKEATDEDNDELEVSTSDEEKQE